MSGLRPSALVLYFLVLGIGAFCGPAIAAPAQPNIVLILADDLGFSDVGCYGGEAQTPNLDQLARTGVRFAQCYNAARCCPSRAALLTGLYPHQAQVGDMVDEYARKVRETINSPAYSDRLNPAAPTIAEVLRAAGYHTGLSGKWHLGYRPEEWPAARGFDSSFTVIEGAMNYYGFGMQHTGMVTNPPMALNHEVYLPPKEGFFATEAFTEYALSFIDKSAASARPFFLYLAYTAPHWPLHARAENIARYRGSYRKIGWDKLREQRYQKSKAQGLIASDWPLAPRPANVRPWEEATPERQDQWDEEMAVYAAQLTEMDNGIGQVLARLQSSGAAANTIVIFTSDNGGAAEDPNRSLPNARLGERDSYEGYGLGGAHISCSPFRKTKKYSHEGGISGPLIVNWPAGIPNGMHGRVLQTPVHLIDLLPTCLHVARAKFPKKWHGAKTLPPEGMSLASLFTTGEGARRSQPLFWEHEGHRAIRDGNWKLVASHAEPWELYDLAADRTELKDLAAEKPEVVRQLARVYDAWASRAGVKPWPSKPSPANKPLPAKKN